MIRGGRELVSACSRLGGAWWFGVFWVVFQSSFAFEEESDKKLKIKNLCGITMSGCKGWE
jgi:hypothetical protein